MSNNVSKRTSMNAEPDSPLFVPLTSPVFEPGSGHDETCRLTSAQAQTVRRDRRHGVDPEKTAQSLNLSNRAVRAEWARLDARSAGMGESIPNSSRAPATNNAKVSNSQRRPSAEPPVKRMRNLSIELSVSKGAEHSAPASHVTKKDRSSQPLHAISFCTPVEKLPEHRREKVELAQCLSPKRGKIQMSMHSKALAQAMGTEPSSAKSLAMNWRQPWDSKTVRVIARLEREGWASTVVAARVGRSDVAVKSLKRRLQPDYNNLLHAFTHHEQTMIWMTKDSLVSAEIAAKLGVETSLVVAEYHRLCGLGGPKRHAASDETWDDIALRLFPDSRSYDKPPKPLTEDREPSSGRKSKAVGRPRKQAAPAIQPVAQTPTSPPLSLRYATSPWQDQRGDKDSTTDNSQFSWGNSDDDAPTKPLTRPEMKAKSSRHRDATTSKTHATSPTHRRPEGTVPPSMSGAVFSRGDEDSDRNVVKLASAPKAKKRHHSKSAARQNDAAK